MLGAANLGKRYGARWLFRNLEFELGVGDCLAVLGQNGAGKSTLLKTLAGLVDPSEGKISFNEKIGYSALDLAVYPALTAAEHLELTGDLRGCPANAEALLSQVGLSPTSTQLVQEFSTGMRARLKLAIALQAEPSVLLLDEPGAGLDEAGRALIESTISAQLKKGVVILATNEPQERRFATLELQVGA